MLTLWDAVTRRGYCDGLSRRSFLKIGGLAMGGLSLPGLLEAEARAAANTAKTGTPGRLAHQSVIMVYLSGGLSHQDTFDLKMDAPAGIRGEFKPIATRLPGVQVCELLPLTASIMDKLVVIRSLVGQVDEHSSFQSMTGFPMGISQRDGKPHFGSVISRVQGPVEPVMPPFVDLAPVMQHRPYNTPGPGILGQSFRAARMEGDDLALLHLPAGVAPTRFSERCKLLNQFEQFRHAADSAPLDGT